MKKDLLKLLIRLTFLVPVFFLFNEIYTRFFFEKDLQENSPEINKVREALASGAEILYLGESSNTTFRGDDYDKRSISTMIGDFYPGKKIFNINKDASHAGIYYYFLNKIPATSPVKTVIVTLNLRSFDANWIYSDLETPLQKSTILLHDHYPLINRFLLAFKGYDHKSNEERRAQYLSAWKNETLHFPYPFPFKNVKQWDKELFSKGILGADGKKDEAITALACHYVKTYAFQIDTLKNPRIKDFDKIVMLAKERGWSLVFNLMAENIQRANELVGKDVVWLIKENGKLLEQRYRRKGVLVVNNLDNVGDEEYIDRNWTTEHYAEHGRHIIATNVADSLKKFYNREYISRDYTKSQRKESYFQDCEGSEIWGQMQTLSTEKAFSGKKSSEIYSKSPFSITFEMSKKHLPENFDEISLNCHLWMSGDNHSSQLTLEVFDENDKQCVINVPLDSLNRPESSPRWQKINYVFSSVKEFENLKSLKIYFFNPDKTPVYIDDIQVEFKGRK